MTDLPYLTPLDASDLRKAGVEGPWVFGYRDRVRFSEIDALNHVNNTAYLRWFEIARVRYFVAWGMTQYAPNDPQLVMKSQSAGYHAPMFLDEDYLIVCRTRSFRNTSFLMEYACISNGLRATGDAVLVMLEPDGKTKRALPDSLKHRFVEVDRATPA